MALQICPKCKHEEFTWFMDGEPEHTYWYCKNCEYSIEENETKETICPDCNEKTFSYLFNKDEQYWWCSSCNLIQNST